VYFGALIHVHCSTLLLWDYQFQSFASPFLLGLNSPKKARQNKPGLVASLPLFPTYACLRGNDEELPSAGWAGHCSAEITAELEEPETNSWRQNQSVCNTEEFFCAGGLASITSFERKTNLHFEQLCEIHT